MRKSFILFFVFILLMSCKHQDKFYVSGKISDASGKTLYFEHQTLNEITVIDSVKLKTKGNYSFKSSRPEYPDFYRLRLDNNVITFAVDSCEEISIDAGYNQFATEYTVNGSETSVQIQKLRKSVMNIQRKVNEISPKMTEAEQNTKIAAIEKDIDVHKEMARRLILQNPRSLAAYFAIYQQVNNTYLFSPFVKADKAYCKAVATSFNVFMPEYIRTKNLYICVMNAINEERKTKESDILKDIISKGNAGYIDISLPDKNNFERKLSSFEGKLVLIDFVAFEARESVDYIFGLRDLYSKFQKRGFEIYQISVDRNKTLWLQSVSNLPWTCVRDENGPETMCISSYNIHSVPTSFILNKSGTIIGRFSGLAGLQKAIEKNL